MNLELYRESIAEGVLGAEDHSPWPVSLSGMLCLEISQSLVFPLAHLDSVPPTIRLFALVPQLSCCGAAVVCVVGL